MSERPRRSWQEMTTAEVGRLAPERVVAVLPAGAIEQHGPHLPLSVDADIAAGILARALERVPAEVPVTALPLLSIGASEEHADFPGTLSLSAETIIETVVGIGANLARAGVRRLAILNAHGGQVHALEIAALRLRRLHRMLVVPANTYDLYDAAALFPAEEVRIGIHGGAVETSIMLHLKPEAVRMDAARRFDSATERMARDHRHLSPQGRTGFAWMSQDLNPDGVVGDARAADAARGKALVEEAAGKLASLLAEMASAPLDILKDRS
ncbi:MAG: creatininase family protein [Alphaproteobacteria bacterium]